MAKSYSRLPFLQVGVLDDTPFFLPLRAISPNIVFLGLLIEECLIGVILPFYSLNFSILEIKLV